MKKYFIGLLWIVVLLSWFIALIAEWILDMITKMITVVHEGVRDVALALEKIKNEPDSRKI